MDRSKNASQAADVIRESNAADNLDEDYTDSFFISLWSDISEAYCEHNCRGPVVGPNVSFEPPLFVDSAIDLPVVMRIDLGHQTEANCDEVGKDKIEENDLDNRSILLISHIGHEPLLQSVDFLYQFGYFCGHRDQDQDIEQTLVLSDDS